MLVISSDIHLGDGTTANSISPSAFDLFSDRLRETAYYASFRPDGSYRPIETLDLLLMGDILDPLHSTLWLDTSPGAQNYTRPWTDINSQSFANTVAETTKAIIDLNRESLDLLRRCANGEIILLPPANAQNGPDEAQKNGFRSTSAFITWLATTIGTITSPGKPSMKCVRASSIRWDSVTMWVRSHTSWRNILLYRRYCRPMESLSATEIVTIHFNFNREKGRNHSTLGDVFTMDVCNRFPVEVQKRYGDQLPKGIIDSLRRITNVRPALATPLWISGQIKRYAQSAALETELKKVWDDLCDEFLQLDVVREQDKAFKFDVVDALQLILKISKRASFETLNDIVLWVNQRLREKGRSLAEHALQEPAFLNNSAHFIVYGHTHFHEIVPLDLDGEPPKEQNQLYINSGTWRAYYDLAVKDPREQKFVPYETFTYLTFYKDGERRGQAF